ncbi:hypothetical protein CBM2615_B60080 [Cupriavidus taiwanensis]|nr:hypothetical protein CBM2615_B60080 [Cupriavidus taiwanensis]
MEVCEKHQERRGSRFHHRGDSGTHLSYDWCGTPWHLGLRHGHAPKRKARQDIEKQQLCH